MWKIAVLFAILIASAAGDMYLHNPRGSNNRLNGQNANRNNANRLFDSQNNGAGGYVIGPSLHYYVNSMLEIEYTSQHGSGNNPNVNCQIVIQYMCGDDVRDGTTTDTPPDNANYNITIANPDPLLYRGNFDDSDEVYVYGMHESYEYYQECKVRSRNKGLFIADRNIGSPATRTRQNNGGTRRGFECPEERDYYPYWHPTPWVDIAVLADDRDRCQYYKDNSENRDGRYYCTEPVGNTYATCQSVGGEWRRAENHGGRDVDCVEADYSRDNHLGNGFSGKNNRYYWRIPDRPHSHCVLRVRYNISTNDYDGWDTHSSSNGPNSPVKQDPYIEYGYWDEGVEANVTLALDTSQFGRTFQDRSHTFEIRRSSRSSLARIYNVNVRGKRGNIVQTYPAFEYDFVPTFLTVSEGDYVHYQWTGGNHNPAGFDGEGKNQLDRHNFIEVYDLKKNYPISYGDSALLSNRDAFLMAHQNQSNCATYEELYIAHGGNAGQIAQDDRNCMVLNAANPYFNFGTMQVSPGKYRYICSRNNNFTNRSQKGSLTVDTFLPVWAIVLVVLSSVICLSAIGVSVFGFVARLLPKENPVAKGWRKVNFLKDSPDDADDGADAGGDVED